MKKVLTVVTLVLLVACPLVAFAVQTPAELLSGSGGGLVPQCEGAFCRACDLIELSSNVINFAIAFSVIIATLMFAYAGILYVTAASKPDQVKKAHGVFINVFVGLCIVLTAWLLVNITFSVLTGKGLAIWSDIDCISAPVSGAFSDAPDLPNGGPITGTAGTPVTTALPLNRLTQAEALRRLTTAGVCGGAVPCFTGTSLQGVRANTIDQLIEIHRGCGCQFTVTSAVRAGGPHSTGYKIDLRTNNPALDTFLKSLSDGRYSAGWDPGRTTAMVYTDACNNVYALETPVRGSSSAPHWDINVIGGVCRF